MSKTTKHVLIAAAILWLLWHKKRPVVTSTITYGTGDLVGLSDLGNVQME